MNTPPAIKHDLPAMRIANQLAQAITSTRPEILTWLAFHGEVRARAAVAYSPYLPGETLQAMLNDPSDEVVQAARFASEGPLCV